MGLGLEVLDLIYWAMTSHPTLFFSLEHPHWLESLLFYLFTGLSYNINSMGADNLIFFLTTIFPGCLTAAWQSECQHLSKRSVLTLQD